MDGQITPVHLIQPLYKHLMGWPVTFKDLEHIDDQVRTPACLYSSSYALCRLCGRVSFEQSVNLTPGASTHALCSVLPTFQTLHCPPDTVYIFRCTATCLS
jgi:hypothetical protein